MVAEKHKNGTKNNNEPTTLEWWGLQFYTRQRGTNEIVTRSFPFWAPSIEFARAHAKKSNGLSKEERTHWTHIKVLHRTQENEAGHTEIKTDLDEVKL